MTRWINANDKLILQEFDCALPVDEINPEQRTNELEQKRKLYQLKENVPGAPKQVVELPDDERFSNEYQVCSARKSRMAINIMNFSNLKCSCQSTVLLIW